ncbi:MAG: hypothetical protein RL318_2414 [Fibrobacterota bacterium]|jgi:hypothetical protein
MMGISSAKAAINIDFNKTGRQEVEVNEPGWTPWPVADVASESKTISGITFKVTMAGSGGSTLTTDWYKVLVQSPNYARMAGDGLIVKDGNAGGAIKLEISGLSAGSHSLLAYHNTTDGNQWAEINVDVDGVRKVTNLKPSNRVLTTDASVLSYVTFTATAGKTVTLLYSPNASSSSSYKNVYINGLVLDVPNPKAQASGAVPEDRDWHVNADAGSVTLSWKTASGAKSHGVYVGTDSATVAKATTSSAEYKGAQTTTTYVLSKPSVHKRVWWRIDETGADGAVTQGQLWCFEPRRLAFRDAEGHGRYARGGRGGKVVHVTNLNDAGAGSLREAVENDIGPRTIVLDVAGLITLKSRLTLSSDRVTFAGQTAPGKGVVVKSCPFGMSGADDAIIRFLKVRLGYTGLTWDGTGLNGCSHAIMDHASVSWTIDEAFSSRSGKNLTLQRTMLAEALNVADHQNYPAGTGHGYAATIGGDIGSYHHNLLAHNEGRNWSLGGGLDGDGAYAGRLDIFNNVVYNWEGRSTDGGAHEVNFVGNYYKEGAATTMHYALNAQLEGTGKGSQAYYYKGNILQAKDGSVTCDGTKDDCGRKYVLSGGQVLDWTVWATAPFFTSNAKIQTAKEAYKDVLSDVGMTMPVYDDHDKRIVKEVLTGTTSCKGSKSGLPGLPDRETDVGGYESYPTTTRPAGFDTDADGLPDWYETAIGTSPTSAGTNFADANADPDGDGWTNLEDYLDWMATPHAEVKMGASTSFDLASLFAGYTSSPAYSVSTNACLTSSIASGKLSVSPVKGCGFVRLSATAKDADGHSKSRDLLLYTALNSVGTGARGQVGKNFAWSVDARRVGVHTDATGSLVLNDLSGRVVARVEGTGDLGIDVGALPHRVLLARFDGDGLHEVRLISPAATALR